jgi:sporulation protein YlmC with PRC-barrel domain
MDPLTETSTHGALEFPIGADVACEDGHGGTLTRVVIDPTAERVTHVVIETKGGRLARLVPIDLLDVELRRVRLHCSSAELKALPAAEEAEYLPVVSGGAGLGYGPGSSFIWPYYGLAGNSIGIGGGGRNTDVPVIHDRLPLGEVAVRRNQCVSATDGDIGRVKGLVLLKEGHLWDRKEVAIPIGTVTSVTDGIKVSLDKEEIGDLPSLVIEHPEWE